MKKWIIEYIRRRRASYFKEQKTEFTDMLLADTLANAIDKALDECPESYIVISVKEIKNIKLK